MRIRTVKPEFFKDDELASLPPLARLLFIGLWCLADGEGRLEDRPTRIGVEVLPYDRVDVDGFLDALHEHAFITRYSVDERGYIEVRSFRRHQRIGGKEAMAASEFPPPDNGEAMVKQRGSSGEATGKLPMRGKERKGKERKVGAFAPPNEEEWLTYVKETYPSWPKPDALSAHGWYESKAWAGVRDWRACAKTCFYRWAGKPVPRNGRESQAIHRALVGSHPNPSPVRDISTASPELQDIARRIANREDTTEAEDDAYAVWLKGGAR